MRVHPKKALTRVQTLIMETFGMGSAMALTALILVSAVVLFAVFWFFHSAPPDTITISTGPEGSVFQSFAKRYSAILAKERVKLKIIPSRGLAGKSEETPGSSFPRRRGLRPGGHCR